MRLDHGRRGLDYRAAIAFDIRWPCNHGADKVWRLLIANWEIYYDARCVSQTMSPGRPLVARFASRLCMRLVRRWTSGVSYTTLSRGVAVQLEVIQIAWER